MAPGSRATCDSSIRASVRCARSPGGSTAGIWSSNRSTRSTPRRRASMFELSRITNALPAASPFPFPLPAWLALSSNRSTARRSSSRSRLFISRHPGCGGQHHCHQPGSFHPHVTHTCDTITPPGSASWRETARQRCHPRARERQHVLHCVTRPLCRFDGRKAELRRRCRAEDMRCEHALGRAGKPACRGNRLRFPFGPRSSPNAYDTVFPGFIPRQRSAKCATAA